MSDALKNRLKKTSRFYHSPVSGTNASIAILATPHQQSKSWLNHKTNSAFKSPVINDQSEHPNIQTPTSATRYASYQTSDGEGTRRMLVEDFIADTSCSNDDHTEHLTELVKDNSSEFDRGLKRKMSPADECHITDNRWASAVSSLDDASSESLTELLQRKKQLMMMISEKEENIRKLKMVKLYRSKVSDLAA